MVPPMVGVLSITFKPISLGEIAKSVLTIFTMKIWGEGVEVMLQLHSIFSSLGDLTDCWIVEQILGTQGNMDIVPSGPFWMMTRRVPDDDYGYCI